MYWILVWSSGLLSIISRIEESPINTVGSSIKSIHNPNQCYLMILLAVFFASNLLLSIISKEEHGWYLIWIEKAFDIILSYIFDRYYLCGCYSLHCPKRQSEMRLFINYKLKDFWMIPWDSCRWYTYLLHQCIPRIRIVISLIQLWFTTWIAPITSMWPLLTALALTYCN